MPRRARPEPIELRIEDLAFGGEGVGRHEDVVHFVPGAFPGERVRALPVRFRKQWRRARLLEVLEPSPHRIPPRCSHTALCGGCVYQCLAYERQLAAKAKQVRDNLERIAGLVVPEPEGPLPAPETTHYRNKMEFSFAPRAWEPDAPPEVPSPDPALGLHVRGRFDGVFDVRDCILPDPEVNDLLERIRAHARRNGIPSYDGRTRSGILRHLLLRMSRATGAWLVALVVREMHPEIEPLAAACRRAHPRISGFLAWIHEGLATVARADREIPLFGTDRIVERLLDLEFELSATSFFQTNTAGAERLLETVRGWVDPVETILDLYCGVGTLGLGLAGRCRRLVGVESVPAAVEDARRNARRNGVEHAEFLAAPAEDWLPSAREVDPDLVVVDPPRAGMHPKALSGLRALAPPRILYVSCNPATLARDLVGLREAQYAADRLQILDLFPHTPHVETIVSLRRVPG